MARQLGLGMRKVEADAVSLGPWRLPLLAEFTGGQIAVINRMDNDGNVSLQFSGDGGLETTLTREALGARLKTLLVLRRSNPRRMPAWMITSNPMRKTGSGSWR